MPENASLNAAGFRMYEWPGGDSDLHKQYHATKPMNVISVTAARSVIGIPYQLQTWQINNVVNLATGQRRAEWPVFTADGSIAVHYEHDVLITENGPEILTAGLEEIRDVIA